MGLSTSFIVLIIVFAAVFGMFQYTTTLNQLAGTVGFNTSTGQLGGGGNLWNNALLLLAGGAIVAVTLIFPNPYTLFAAITGLMLAFVSMVFDFMEITEFPVEIKVLIVFIFGIVGVFGAIWFLKGGEA